MARTASEWESPPRLPISDYVSSDIYTDGALFDQEQRLLKRRSWKFPIVEIRVPRK